MNKGRKNIIYKALSRVNFLVNSLRKAGHSEMSKKAQSPGRNGRGNSWIKLKKGSSRIRWGCWTAGYLSNSNHHTSCLKHSVSFWGGNTLNSFLFTPLDSFIHIHIIYNLLMSLPKWQYIIHTDSSALYFFHLTK